MFAIKNNATQHACFITVGFREAALNFREEFAAEDDYYRVLEVWGEGEAELFDRFENVGAMCAELFERLADVIPAGERGLFEYEVPQKLGALLCEHVYRTGDFMPWAKIRTAARDLMVAYYEGALVPLAEMDTETVHDIALKEIATAEREAVILAIANAANGD